MAIKAGLYTPNIQSIANDIPTAESVANDISNTSSISQLKQNNLAGLANMRAAADSLAPEQESPESAQVFYSPSTRKMFVNGLMFDDDDAKTALESVNYLESAPIKPSGDVATDWSRVAPKEYGSYIKGIKNPQAGRLFAENFDIGGSNLKLLFGRASQFFGAEDYGQGLVNDAVRELEKNEPFQREFTSIKSGYISDGDAGESHDAIDWFVANFAQQGPNLIESVAAALIGFGVGAVAGGGANPLTGIGAAIAGVLGKSSYKQAVLKAAKKYNKDRKSLTSGERKLLREISSLTAVAKIKNPNIYGGLPLANAGIKRQILKENKDNLDKVIKEGLPGAANLIAATGKQQAISGGITSAFGISSYGMGLGDTYGEQRELGQDNRLTAALTAIPYAAMEMLPEFVLAARLFKVNPKQLAGAAKLATSGGRTSRGLKGFGVGGVLEGLTEVGQESLILANTGQFDINSPEVRNRLINSFAAGAAVGGPIGGAANLLSKPSANILDPSNTNTEPPAPNAPLSGKEKLTAGTATLSGTTGDPAIGQQLPLPGIEGTVKDRLNTDARELNELKPVPDTPEVATVSSQTNIPDLTPNDTIEGAKPVISKSRGKRIKEGRGEESSAIAIGEIVTVGGREALITSYVPNADKSTLENPRKMGYTDTAYYGYEYTDVSGQYGSGTEAAIINQNKDLVAKPIKIREAKARFKKFNDAKMKAQNAKIKAENERIAAEYKAEQKAEKARIAAEKKAEKDRIKAEKKAGTKGEALKAPSIENIKENVELQRRIDVERGRIPPTDADRIRLAQEEAKVEAEANKLIKDNNIDTNSEEFKNEAQEVFGDLGPAGSRMFAAEQIIKKRKEKAKVVKAILAEDDAKNSMDDKIQNRYGDLYEKGEKEAELAALEEELEGIKKEEAGEETAFRKIVGGKVLYQLSESFNSVDTQAEIDNAELTESYTPIPSGGVNFVQLNGTKEQHERFVQDARGLIVSFGNDAVEAMSDFAIRTMPKKGGAQNDKKQSSAEMAEGEQSGTGGAALKANAKKSDTTNKSGPKKSVGKKETGKEKLQVEEDKDSVRKDIKESVDKSEDIKRKNNEVINQEGGIPGQTLTKKQINEEAAKLLVKNRKGTKTDRRIIANAKVDEKRDDAEAKEKAREPVVVSGKKLWNDKRKYIPGASTIEYGSLPISSQKRMDELATDSDVTDILLQVTSLYQQSLYEMLQAKTLTSETYVDIQIDIVKESNVAFERETAYEIILSHTRRLSWMGDADGNKKANAKAEGFLNTIILDNDYNRDLNTIVDKLVVRHATKLSDANIRIAKESKAPWLKYAEQRGLVSAIDSARGSRTGGVQKEFINKKNVNPRIIETNNSPQIDQSPDVTVEEVEKYIVDLLEYETRIESLPSELYDTINNEYAKLSTEQKNSMVLGRRLKFYFDEKTKLLKLKSKVVDNITYLIPVTTTDVRREASFNKFIVKAVDEGKKENKLKKKTDAIERNKKGIAATPVGDTNLDFIDENKKANLTRKQIDNQARKEANEIAALEDDAYSPYDDDDGRNFISEDGKPAVPMAKGKVKLFVKQFVSKLKIKPTVTVVDNYLDLEANYPKLYQRAKDGRKKNNNDFGTVDFVAGYSIGDQVIIFSDFILGKSQLNFIIAHETIGHFGIKAIIGRKEFNNVMQYVYDSDSSGDFKSTVDILIENGMDKYEAIEETLADAAAYLDTHLIAKVWNVIKNVLNKLGVTFSDDGARYFINQSRRYLRTGTGGYVSIEQLRRNINQLEKDRINGRYHVQEAGNLGKAVMNSHAMNKTAGDYGGFAGAIKWMEELWAKKPQSYADFKNSIDKKLESIQSLNNLAGKNEGIQELYNTMQQIQAQVRAYTAKYAEMSPFSYKPNTLIPFGDKKFEPDTVEIEDEEGNPVTVDNDAGLIASEKEQVGQLLAFAAMHLRNKYSDAKIKDLGLEDLLNTVDKNGKILSEFTLNQSAFEAIRKAAELTQEDFTNGFKIDTAMNKDGTELKKEDDMDPDFSYTFRASKLNEDGSVTEGEAPGDFTPFVISNRVWKAYQETVKVVVESSKDVLESNVVNFAAQKNDILKTLRNYSQEEFKGEHLTTINNIMNKYKELYYENHTLNAGKLVTNEEAVATADKFLENAQRAMFQEDKIQDWINENPNEVPVYNRANAQEDFADIKNGLVELHQILKGKKDKAFDIKKSIESLLILDRDNIGKSYTTKASILGGYVPFTRRGSHQVTVRAYDENGNRIQVEDKLKDSMPYYQAGTNADAIEIRNKLNDTFSPSKENEETDRKYMPFTIKDTTGNEIKNVQFIAEVSEVKQGDPFQNEMDLFLFNRKLNELGYASSPKQRERITQMLTKQEDRARSSLLRSGNPGWDLNVLKNVAEHLEIQSHLVGRNFHRYKIDRIMDNSTGQPLWFGNPNKLKKLHDELLSVEEGTNQEAKQEARRRYDRYANQFRYSADSRDPRFKNSSTVTVYRNKGVLGNGEREAVEMPMLARGNNYKQKGQSLIDFYARNPNVGEDMEDTLSKSKLGQSLKLMTVTSQLGFSVATGYINMLAMETHSVNYLAGYNPESGYGGGFGFMTSQKAMYKSFTQMNDIFGTLRNQGRLLGKNESAEDFGHKHTDLAGLHYVEQMAGVDKDGNILGDQKTAKAIQDKHGITEDEARVLYEATKAGVLQASQYNALIGTARGGIGNVKLSAAVKRWMSIFSYTEQLNRRTTFLASYRLQKKKLMAAKEETVASAETISLAASWSRDAVNTSQGEYSMFNRPEISRGNLFSYLMVYKQFMIISTELMSNMPRKQKLAFLGMLFLFSGLKGLPFAEDMADIFDTLMQKFGFEIATVEKEANDFIEGILPGASPYVMRGFMDSMTGATMSTRLGMGDMVPLTGLGKAGSDPWRETSNFLGPVWSAGAAGWATIKNISLATGSTLGLNNRNIGLKEILREQPFGGIRGITDSIVFAADGQITNRQGKVISKEVSASDIIFRFLNFYPAKANYQNDIIRMHKQTADYVKLLKMEYTHDYVKARLAGDKDETNDIRKDVARHNKKHRGTEFEFNNWRESADRAYKAWSLPAAKRYAKFAPKNIRPDLKRAMDAYGIE